MNWNKQSGVSPYLTDSFIKNRIGDTVAIPRVSNRRFKRANESKLPPTLYSFLAMIDTKPVATMDQVMRAVTLAGYDLQRVISKSRKRPTLYIRYAVAYLLLYWTKPRMSLKAIGEVLGGRDHTTIMNIEKVLKDMADTGDQEIVMVHVRRISAAIKNVLLQDGAKEEVNETVKSLLINQTSTESNHAIRYTVTS